MLDTYDEVLTIQDLCSILLIGRNAAYRLLNNHEIEAWRIGNRWKISKAAVCRYLTQPKH